MRFVPRKFGFSLFLLGLIAAASAFVAPSQAQDAEGDVRLGFSGNPVPRFVALKKDLVYGRAGPDQDVVVIYRRKGLPVKVIAETSDNVWRRIEDPEGRRVWINRVMLVENRHAITQEPAILFAEPTRDALPRVKLEPGVMAKLETCEGAWCRVKTPDYRGWTDRDALWGSPLSSNN